LVVTRITPWPDNTTITEIINVVIDNRTNSTNSESNSNEKIIMPR